MKLLVAISIGLAILATFANAESEPVPTIETIRRCRRTPLQPPTDLQCKAHMPRWTWNDVTRVCESLIFGGCRGTDNLFLTQDECQQSCGLMRRTPGCPADSIFDKKDCDAKRIMNSETGCFGYKIHCPNRPRKEPCPPLAQAVQSPRDCVHMDLKDENGCDYSVLDCQNGPTSS